jgi:hypothetical protein
VTSCKGEWEYSAISDELRRGRPEGEIMVDKNMVDVWLVTVSIQWGVTGFPMDIVEEVIITRDGAGVVVALDGAGVTPSRGKTEADRVQEGS